LNGSSGERGYARWRDGLRRARRNARGDATRSHVGSVLVLDISEYIAGPYCAARLADLGARVIEVEPPDGAEERRLGNRKRYRGNTHMALAFNHGKESLAVDLRREAGRAILYRLIAKVDMVIQNTRRASRKSSGSTMQRCP
jgi:crotonobetainyl-CoA:carnitine CoA-transferase CaiB-like acyl-CoA transferase